MNAALWIVSVIAILIILDVYNKKEEKRHKEAIQGNKEFQRAIEDFTHAVERLEITEEQFNSQRRWMRGTMNSLKDHGEKLEAHLAQFEEMTEVKENKQLTMSELVENMMKEGK